jgi:hypothetical protein
MSAKTNLIKAFTGFITSSGFYTNISEHVYHDEAPQRGRDSLPDYPYAVWTISSDLPSIDSGSRTDVISITMNFYSIQNSSYELDTLESEYMALMDGQTDNLTLTTDNYSVILIKREFNNDLPRLENVWSSVVQYQVILQKNRS